MLSYQHIYHAGCLADVYKHSILSILLTQLIQKERALSYIETHAGRGLYDLNSPEAQKTGEFREGIERVLERGVFPESHPYIKIIRKIENTYNKHIYPGSAAIAQEILRSQDSIHLMELHPQEVVHLRKNIIGDSVHIHHRDGYEGALAMVPPLPRRGVIFIDPSFEVKQEYQDVVVFIQKLRKKWPEGSIVLWYPVLEANYHERMIDSLLKAGFKNTYHNEMPFTHSLEKSGMLGSGMVIINCPFGVDKIIEDSLKPMIINEL